MKKAQNLEIGPDTRTAMVLSGAIQRGPYHTLVYKSNSFLLSFTTIQRMNRVKFMYNIHSEAATAFASSIVMGGLLGVNYGEERSKIDGSGVRVCLLIF